MTVAGQLERLGTRLRSNLRAVLWWAWPSHPTSLSEVPQRLRPSITQISRLTVAAVVAYLVAQALSPGTIDLTAPLTALLVVQASTVGTVKMGLVRVGAVLTGVLIAVGVASAIGLSWWSLGAVIAASLVIAKVLRLGEQSLEAPISAMLILAVSAPGTAAEGRVLNTLIGTAVGVAFSLLVPVSTPNARAVDLVRQVARSQAALLDEVALSLANRAPHPEEVRAWFDWADDISRTLSDASAAVQVVEDSRQLNPRALAAATVHTGLRAVIDRLERCLAAERALLVVISREAPVGGAGLDTSTASDLRQAFAVVLDDLANGLRSFGDLVRAEYDRGRVEDVDALLGRTLDIVRETRAVLTELVLLDVDRREQPDIWIIQGSVLAAVEQVLRQLDLEQDERSRQPWLERHPIPIIPLEAAPQSGGLRLRRRRGRKQRARPRTATATTDRPASDRSGDGPG